MSFSRKRIEIRVTLGAGSFGSVRQVDGSYSKNNTIIIKDHACDVQVSKPGQNTKNGATVAIYNLSESDIAQLTFLGFGPRAANRNEITILAGEGDDLTVVFEGDILPGGAKALYGGNNRILQIEACTADHASRTPMEPTSVKGEASAADLIRMLTEQIGFSFSSYLPESFMLSDSYFSGSPVRQIQAIAEAAGIELMIDDRHVILVTKGAARKDIDVVQVSAATGLIDYPSFSQIGVDFRHVFDPRFKFGCHLELESVVPQASGLWRINSVNHSLSYGIQRGKWETALTTLYPVELLQGDGNAQ